ncbi:hypothetical protein CEF21_06135 [Bacillus sp. FJAT-42376]|uniref:hypothetical protein n=1 Tax=Bacillus sp. FJAT-42376 TaxID=2014076 RepID=UPI000F4F7AE9|nr:hypothetical protein [Bacillus sp. FJAT-42376]AZB41918.1 hypothetical protein CEF21_06135 [Bacillus sp. FJAT-42376]
MTSTETVNSPDLVFQQYCKEVFGVNRGIYNTIDEWFFQAGAVSVLKRRRLILDFLQDLSEPNPGEKAALLKVGKGGLAPALLAFWKKSA